MSDAGNVVVGIDVSVIPVFCDPARSVASAFPRENNGEGFTEVGADPDNNGVAVEIGDVGVVNPVAGVITLVNKDANRAEKPPIAALWPPIPSDAGAAFDRGWLGRKVVVGVV